MSFNTSHNKPVSLVAKVGHLCNKGGIDEWWVTQSPSLTGPLINKVNRNLKVDSILNANFSVLQTAAWIVQWSLWKSVLFFAKIMFTSVLGDTHTISFFCLNSRSVVNTQSCVVFVDYFHPFFQYLHIVDFIVLSKEDGGKNVNVWKMGIWAKSSFTFERPDSIALAKAALLCQPC